MKFAKSEKKVLFVGYLLLVVIVLLEQKSIRKLAY